MIKAILFDLDGVLVDSKQATIEYFQETMRHFGLPIPSKEKFRFLLGLKTIDITKSLLPSLDDKKILSIYEYSRKISLKYVPKIQLIHGSISTLKKLKKQYKLALITSRGKKTVQILLKKYDLEKYFQLVIDREDVVKHKPDPEGIYQAMDRLGVKSSEAIFVGDMKEDVQCAHNAGILCILVSREKEDFHADYKVSNISEVSKILKKNENFKNN